MQDGYDQAGGFDPGLAALIASLVTGGVGAYGYSKADGAKQEAAIQAALGADWKEQIESSKKIQSEKQIDEKRIKDLEATVAALTAKNKEIAASAAASSGPALAIKRATPGRNSRREHPRKRRQRPLTECQSTPCLRPAS